MNDKCYFQLVFGDQDTLGGTVVICGIKADVEALQLLLHKVYISSYNDALSTVPFVGVTAIKQEVTDAN